MTLDWPTSWNWFNVTRCIGLAVYAAGVVACCLAAGAARRRAHRSSRRVWMILAALHLLLLVDMALSVRHGISGVLGGIARDQQWYRQRHGAQLLAVTGTMLAAILAAVGLLWQLRRHGRATLLAVAGTSLSLTSLAVSCISLHEVDAILYHPMGPTLVVAVVWMVAGAMVVIGAAISCIGSDAAWHEA